MVISLELPAQIIHNIEYPTGASLNLSSLKASPTGYLMGGNRILETDISGQGEFSLITTAGRVSPVPLDSGFILVYNDFTPSSPEVEAHVKRFDKFGNQIWHWIFDSGIWRNFAEDVIALDDSSFVYAGRHQSVTNSGAILRKLDLNGNLIWERKFSTGSTISTYAKELLFADTSFFVIANANASYDGNGPNRDMSISKHREDNGTIEWYYRFSTDSIDDPTDMLILDGNNVMLLGNSTGDSTTIGYRGVLVKVNYEFGNWPSAVWTQHFGGPTELKLNAIEPCPNGGHLLLGTRASANADSLKTFIMQIDTLGNPVWEYVFASSGAIHAGQEMIRESANVYVIAGHYSDASGQNHFFQTKFNIDDLNSPSTVKPVIEKSGLRVYPNPASSVIQIDLQESDNARIKILDGLGRIVESFQTSTAKVFFDCSKLPVGYYSILVESGGITRSTSFVINR